MRLGRFKARGRKAALAHNGMLVTGALVVLVAGLAAAGVRDGFSAHYWTVVISLLIGSTVASIFAKAIIRRDRALTISAVRNLYVGVSLDIEAQAWLSNRFPKITMPTGVYSMRPANLKAIVLNLDMMNPGVIVEFGSGISTLFIASWIKENQRPTRLLSFEHMEEWKVLCDRYLSSYGLEDCVNLHYAPLIGQNHDGREFIWYDIQDIISSLPVIDMLIVDGPPRDTGPLARMPALDILHEKLSPTAAVFLDDGARPDEVEVVQRWLTRYPEMIEDRGDSYTGYRVLRRH